VVVCPDTPPPERRVEKKGREGGKPLPGGEKASNTRSANHRSPTHLRCCELVLERTSLAAFVLCSWPDGRVRPPPAPQGQGHQRKGR